MKTPKVNDLVRVNWVDSCINARWDVIDCDANYELVECTSVGFVQKWNSKLVCLAGSITKGGQGCCRINIPRKVITKVKILK